jgi:hypothetical protein
MTQQRTPIDFIAYDADGKVVLLAEAKSRRGHLGVLGRKAPPEHARP